VALNSGGYEKFVILYQYLAVSCTAKFTQGQLCRSFQVFKPVGINILTNTAHARLLRDHE